eukprot:GILK01005465.1.p1 GENE.GILK01005465.1~~GILK01005465.1.p1  ORF type:complete len:174 (-),score=34.63 GILK01005465.1:226-714(-)
METSKFWSLLESSFHKKEEMERIRDILFQGDRLSGEDESLLMSLLSKMNENLSQKLEHLPAEELLQVDRIIERLLYGIDLAELHYHTEGDHEGFLAARGFIVAMGEDYYKSILEDPSFAMQGFRFEPICWCAYTLYEKKFGPVPKSAISRESNSNVAGWQGS